MKSIDKSKLTRVKKLFNKDGNNSVLSFTLDGLVQFMTGNNSGYGKVQEKDQFKDVESLQQAIRAIKPDTLNYDQVSKMMLTISGPADSQDSSQMTKDLTDEKKIKTNVDIFPFYKTLSKLCHWSMNYHKNQHVLKKIKNHE